MATENGLLYVYDISEEGGECKLIIKHDLRSVDTNPIRIQGKPTEKLTGNFNFNPSSSSSYRLDSSVHID